MFLGAFGIFILIHVCWSWEGFLSLPILTVITDILTSRVFTLGPLHSSSPSCHADVSNLVNLIFPLSCLQLCSGFQLHFKSSVTLGFYLLCNLDLFLFCLLEWPFLTISRLPTLLLSD